MAFCDVVVARTRLGELTYSWDPKELGDIGVGDCVLVPLRGKKAYGIVTGLRPSSPVKSFRPVTKLIERGFVLPELLSLLRWTGRYYRAGMGGVLDLALPQGIYGYRPRPRRDVDISQQVVCESVLPIELASEASSSDPPAPAFENGFAVYCSARTDERRELVRAFLTERRQQGGGILLLPREKLTSWMPALKAAFGDDLHEYHSGLGSAGRKQAWLKIRRAARPVVVGVRSAVFAPFEELAGIAVVDEHSPVYKEERYPRFHARDVAIARAKAADCPVLLCDRTPSAETHFNLEAGAYRWLDKPPRFDTRPGTFVVDMRGHREKIFSPRLERELSRAAESGVALLYVNRRGLSRHVVCRDCGAVLQCARCVLPFALLSDHSLACGMCGATEVAPDLCPECGGSQFQLRAPGVDLVAREAAKLVVGADVLTMEGDSSEPLPQGKGNVVVGTKTLLFRPWSRLTKLVAAVCIDYDMVVPDFRARERTFQTLHEMERRARALSARFVVQTWRPDDPAVRCAVEQDPVRFLDGELELRAQLGFPPARRLASVVLRGGDERAKQTLARRIARLVSVSARADVLGPIQMAGKKNAPFWRLLIRMERSLTVDRLLGREKLEARGVKVLVDVDPLDVA